MMREGKLSNQTKMMNGIGLLMLIWYMIKNMVIEITEGEEEVQQEKLHQELLPEQLQNNYWSQLILKHLCLRLEI